MQIYSRRVISGKKRVLNQTKDTFHCMKKKNPLCLKNVGVGTPVPFLVMQHGTSVKSIQTLHIITCCSLYITLTA